MDQRMKYSYAAVCATGRVRTENQDRIYLNGTICGGGQELARKIIEDERARIKSFLDDNRELVESCENSDTIPGRVRPRLINLSNCENVWISGITLKNGPSWNVHMIYCDDIQTDHCLSLIHI